MLSISRMESGIIYGHGTKMKSEELVLNAVRAIIDRRRAAHRFPECALRREIENELSRSGSPLDRHAITRHLMNMVSSGLLEYHPTQNDQSYYLK